MMLDLLTGLLIGLVSGAVTSFIVGLCLTIRYRNLDERMATMQRAKFERIAIMQRAKFVADDCQRLVELTDRLVVQLALRKYTAFHIIDRLCSLHGDVKRLTKNEETMKILSEEVPKKALERLCIAIHLKQVDEEVKKRHGSKLGSLFDALDEVIEVTNSLGQSLSAVDGFDTYFDQVESSSIGARDFADFVSKIGEEEERQYEPLLQAREPFGEALCKLVGTMGKYL